MKKITPLKILIFLLVILPVIVFLFCVFIIPLMVVLAVMSVFWSGKIIHLCSFGKRGGNHAPRGTWQEESSNGTGDYVDVESTIVETSVVENEGGSSGSKIPASLPENKD